ncbi:MAG: hypothetical protein V2B18_08150 [Pseudomonadota bacterium]
MKIISSLGLALLFIALPAFAPAQVTAQSADRPYQSTDPRQDRSSNTNRPVDQGIQGTVTGIDQPEGCLRIRREASSSAAIVGCANMNEKLLLKGNYSPDGRWAELADNGWVYAAQIDAPNKPKVQTRARQSYETVDTEEYYPVQSDSSVWREPARRRHGADSGVVYGSSYGYGPGIGIGIGPGGVIFGGGGRGQHYDRSGGPHHGGGGPGPGGGGPHGRR